MVSFVENDGEAAESLISGTARLRVPAVRMILARITGHRVDPRWKHSPAVASGYGDETYGIVVRWEYSWEQVVMQASASATDPMTFIIPGTGTGGDNRTNLQGDFDDTTGLGHAYNLMEQGNRETIGRYIDNDGVNLLPQDEGRKVCVAPGYPFGKSFSYGNQAVDDSGGAGTSNDGIPGSAFENWDNNDAGEADDKRWNFIGNRLYPNDWSVQPISTNTIVVMYLVKSEVGHSILPGTDIQTNVIPVFQLTNALGRSYYNTENTVGPTRGTTCF